MQQARTHWLKWLTLTVLTSLSLSLSLSLSIVSSAYADTQSRSSAFDYDPVSGLLTKEIIEPDAPNLCLVTSYTYDSFGNKTSATTRNCNGSAGSAPNLNTEAAAPSATVTIEGNAYPNPAIITPRTSTSSYDNRGQFPTSSTNALNHTETKTYTPQFGTIASLTGPNGLSTTWTYDSFGNSRAHRCPIQHHHHPSGQS
jgi:YD repeat-containing protein